MWFLPLENVQCLVGVRLPGELRRPGLRRGYVGGTEFCHHRSLDGCPTKTLHVVMR